VGGLVPARDARELRGLAAQAGVAARQRVELGLEVLEREGVVQDLDVLLLRGRAQRERREAAEDDAAGDERAAADGRLAEEVGPRAGAAGIDRVGGLLDGAVGVELLEGDEVGHSASGVGWVVTGRGTPCPGGVDHPTAR
jgi:hypothetical protein